MKKIIFTLICMISTLCVNAQVIKIYENGVLTQKYTNTASTQYKIVMEEAPTNIHEGREYVDLGLPSGIKWATCNVGATSPEEYGNYYAWGETTAKSTFTWSNYKWCNGSYWTQKKYCTSSSYGTVDNKIVLDKSDDAASVNWGGNWRMPTKAEQDELRSNCTWTWTTENGVNGYTVKSKANGKSIFLPAAGYYYESSLEEAGSRGIYKSASLVELVPEHAYDLDLTTTYGAREYYSNRCYGRTIRAVCP